MFTYFGYGSNINLIALRAKGVEPVSSVRGMLREWQLAFNVQHWFRHEGGMGNIRHTGHPNDKVEGMVHLCPDDQLAPLDAMEAYGIGYDRITVSIETEDGPMEALAYIGLPAFLDDTCLPSRRYLNIILRGAEAAGLSQAYIDRLRAHPVLELPDYPEYVVPDEPGPIYTSESLARHPYLTAVAGAVFDMRGARSQLDCLHDLYGGKDMTLHHLRRLDTSDGTETLEDIRLGRISPAGKKYLNAYLHEYDREFKFAGRLVDEDPPPGQASRS